MKKELSSHHASTEQPSSRVDEALRTLEDGIGGIINSDSFRSYLKTMSLLIFYIDTI